MSSLDDVYRKFGETSETAQLLETELGNILITSGLAQDKVLTEPKPERASALLEKINRQTLGRLLANAKHSTESLDHLDGLLSRALEERNRLSHLFFRHHNFRRNTEQGRAIMLKDLQSIHATLLEAYKAVMLLSGVDLDTATLDRLPTKRVPI